MNSGETTTPGHQQSDWINDWNNGSMSGFCDNNTYTPPCFPYSYVVNYPGTTDALPYYQIAYNYGFANYMFQTNEGPSYPAHQFLFTGTSAPVAPSSSYGQYFVVNNPTSAGNGTGGLSGCPQEVDLNWIDPTRAIAPGQNGNLECYPHDSLVTGSTCQNNSTLCDKNSTLFSSSWRYYAPEPGSIWDAPEAIPEVCYGVNSTGNAPAACGQASLNNGTNWKNHMSFYSVEAGAPILSDISNCQLQQISWVIPDAAWSDHPNNSTGAALGPYWVANIVDAIGNSYANSEGTCDYWGNVAPSGSSARKPTAIFIVWDDWGGLYDHVPPPNAWLGAVSGSGFTCGAPNGWGCGYIYGFRVPLLVVSEYTGASTSGGGYISGACGPGQQVSQCPNDTGAGQIYQHDFGSILAFTEFNFDLPQIAAPSYADANTLDAVGGNIPLSDFFPLCVPTCAGRSFHQIDVTNYPASFFQDYYATHSATPTGPDPD